MSAHLFEALGAELDDLLYPLQRAVEVPGALNEVLARIGVPATLVPIGTSPLES